MLLLPKKGLGTARALAVTALALLVTAGERRVGGRKLDGARLALHATGSNHTDTAGRPRVGLRRLAATVARQTVKPPGLHAAALGRAGSLLLRAGNVMFFKNKAPRCLAIARSPAVNPLQPSHNSFPMSEQPIIPLDPAPGPAPKTQPRGYFNQSQLEDIELAGVILQVARNPRHSAALAGKEITEEYLSGLESAIVLARLKVAGTGQAQSGQQPATLNAADAERDLVTVLQAIQSAAKQKHRMLEEEDGAFATEGYLIGQRLNANRATLLQNAATLAAKAAANQLPGYKTPESLAAIEATVEAYKKATATQHERDQETAEDRIARDKLITKINARRHAIQHAADALWPYTGPDNIPIRRAFQIPPDRPLNK